MHHSMEDLREAALTCRACPLCETRRNVVFGVGPLDAKIMLIGEGPGENEDLLGEPFVGRGGQLLDKLLSAVDLTRKRNVYIANMVKCRPPQNRDPKPEEMEACMDWLRNQVALMRPRIIVCLGRISAMKLISPNFKVTKEHGIWFEKNGIYMMGTFHPAALLRNPLNKPDALEDFLSVKAKALELCPESFGGE